MTWKFNSLCDFKQRSGLCAAVEHCIDDDGDDDELFFGVNLIRAPK